MLRLFSLNLFMFCLLFSSDPRNHPVESSTSKANRKRDHEDKLWLLNLQFNNLWHKMGLLLITRMQRLSLWRLQQTQTQFFGEFFPPCCFVVSPSFVNTSPCIFALIIASIQHLFFALTSCRLLQEPLLSSLFFFPAYYSSPVSPTWPVGTAGLLRGTKAMFG